MLAALHPDLELVAATTVNGNNPIAACTDNTLRVFDLLGVDIPVYEGAATPLLRDDFPIPREVLHRDGSMHPPRAADPATAVRQAHAACRRVPHRDLSRRDRRDRAGAGRSAHQHRAGHPARAADRRADPADCHHGRRPRVREHDALRRVQHLGRSGGGTGRPARRAREPHADPARCDAPGARLGRRLRAAACDRHTGCRGRRRDHRGPDRGVRRPPADGHGRHRTRPRRAVRRLPRRSGGRQRRGWRTSTSRPGAS